MNKIKVAIFGASGFGAGELLRLFAHHPDVEVVSLVSTSAEAEVSELHPNLQNNYSNLACCSELDTQLFADRSSPGAIFFALPHGHSGNQILSLMRNEKLSHVKLIDLSGDLRLKGRDLSHKWYPNTEYIDSERSQIIYGIPELYREQINKARVVSNPGCLAIASILALTPLKSFGINGQIVIDAKTGTSGAGRTPQNQFHHPTMHANSFAYKVLEHRHEAEISQNLDYHQVAFVPHVIPTSRGILVSCYLNNLTTKATDLVTHYNNFYNNSPFIKVIDSPPELRNVIGSNYCQIFVTEKNGAIFVSAAIDNLVKGMAGNAIQNMNLCFGIGERVGLEGVGLGVG